MKISLSTGVFSQYPILTKIDLIKKLGFENIEFNMKNVPLGNELLVYEIKNNLEKQKLNCLTVHAATFPVTEELEIPKAIYFGKVSAHFASILSAPLMIIHSNVSRKSSKNKQIKFLKIIHKEIQSYAKTLNIKLALENLSDPSKSIGNDVSEIKRIFEIIDNENLGFVLDFCHGEITGQTLELLDNFENRLLNVHISNKNHAPLTSKTSNLKDFLFKLQDVGYDGPLTLDLNQNCNINEIIQTKSIIENIVLHK